MSNNVNVPRLTQTQLATHLRLGADLQYFARRTPLKLISKAGKIETLDFNEAQQIIHEAVEKMLRDIGWVRVIIIKGRQQGCSTYVAARYYHKACTIPGTRVLILSHETASTTVLFGKVSMYHEGVPEQIKPETEASNRKELKLKNKSNYVVATAGAENTGRSDTTRLGHFSEPAFYPNPEGVKAGAVQTIPDMPGTEIIWESTCNGMNWWYDFTMDAVKGLNGYRVIFIPWYIQKEYFLPVPADFKLEGEEGKLKTMYNLSNGQIYWRRMKIAFFKSVRMFKQEYPFTLAEAFQTSGDRFYEEDWVARARKSRVKVEFGPVVIGVDPARKGDRTVIAVRRGRRVLALHVYREMDSVRLASILARLIPEYGADKCFIDWGEGSGTIDILRNTPGFKDIVEGVYFGSAADDPIYQDKRTEMFFDFKHWLTMEGDVGLPDDDDMALDIGMLPDYETTNSGIIQFPSKKKMKELLNGKSTDILDAIALTFARKVRCESDLDAERRRARIEQQSRSPLSTLNRVRGVNQYPKRNPRNPAAIFLPGGRTLRRAA